MSPGASRSSRDGPFWQTTCKARPTTLASRAMANTPKGPKGPPVKKSKAPLPMEDTKSEVESFHRGNSPNTRRALAMMSEDSTVSIQAPSPLKRGNKKVTPGFVGFRQAARSKGDPEEKVERLRSMKSQLREKRDERRQEMWDKLDTARKNADDRLRRYSGFEPSRSGAAPAPEPAPDTRRPRSSRARRGRRR